jgi:hypothetical protein
MSIVMTGRRRYLVRTRKHQRRFSTIARPQIYYTLLSLISRLQRFDELFLAFQPQVNADNYKLVGTEALVRWRHPERGLIIPSEFIPMAEETGLIVPIGEHVLRLARRQAAAWRETALRIPISVNLSAIQLQEPGLRQTVISCIEDAGLTADAITLELTESAILHDLDAATQTMRQPERTFLQQAYEALRAPDAAAMVGGSAVDAMLKELGYKDGSVYSRIDKAVAELKLTDGMGRWAHEVRLGSNRPRRADTEKPHVSLDEAKQSVEFAEALGYFLFVLTEQIARGTVAAKEASGEGATG